ncbi:multiheme c-type cytochrome [Tundrisphaera sp. TA3]|uniref:multiheme c-type cytochrome n=1 Tax=Tundrisphaera sp. TA3 TaxID=3435775 RepID=UPI003EB71254
MIALSWWKRGGLLAGMGLAIGALATPGPRSGLTADPQAPPVPNLYTGSQSCVVCHNVPPDSKQTPFDKARTFIRLNEFDTWRNHDKHSLAYENLTGPRGRGMAEKLKVDVTKAEAGCLGCHSAGAAELQNRVVGNLFNRDEGVSCENCHGPASNWGGTTHALGTLRLKTPAERAQLGLNDLRTSEHLAEQCLSCHIGSVKEEKVVTHAMYAAGHPPLPSVEVALFSDKMPRHWNLDDERTDPTVRKELGTKDGQRDRTKLAIVGAAVALRTTMNLIADEAHASDGFKAPGQTWPDYARFDCYACHHALKRESWRQERGYEGTPGRPVLNEWPLAMVELGIQRLMLDDPAAKELLAGLEMNHKAMLAPTDARPFGRRGPVEAAARSFSSWTSLLIDRLSAASYDKAVTRKLLHQLVESSIQTAPDFDAARHVGWGIEVLIKDLDGDLPRKAEVEAILKDLRTQLDLDLPTGREQSIEEYLSRALNRAAEYDPNPFRERLMALLPLLPPG